LGVKAPRFEFRLERVRALRERLEELSREELAASLGHRLRVEAELQEALAEVDGARGAYMRTVGGDQVSGSELVAAQAYLERTDSNRRLAAEDLRQRDAEVAERRQHLAERARERQALERLKDRRRAEHELAAQRVEGLALDELAIQRHRRQVA
jgi:flagellar protein FliJ